MKIVIICIDALRADSVGPRMQEFLESGREYVNAYAAGPTTIPSVPTCLTGVPAGQHGLVTAHSRLRVTTIAERLSDRGFHTVGYSANNLASLPQKCFDEWFDLRWMSNYTHVGEATDDDPLYPGKEWNGRAQLKATQESYEEIWDDIRNRKGDLFAYIHLMDPHEPFRQIEGVPIDAFPHDYRTFRFNQWIVQAAVKGKSAPTKKQWKQIWKLYKAEIAYLDERIEFPGDLTILIADHGQLIAEGPGGGWLGHSSKHFYEELLRIPFGIRGLGGKKGVKVKRPFHLMYLPHLIERFLDGKPLPKGDDLYWEDYWYECATFAVKNSDSLLETLVMHSTGEIWYVDKKGNETTDLAKVPSGGLIRRLTERVVRANLYPMVFMLKDREQEMTKEEKEIIEGRLRGMGYIP